MKILLSKKIGYVYFVLVGVLFVFFQLVESKLNAAGDLAWTGGFAGRTLAISLLAGGALGASVAAVVYYLSGRKRSEEMSVDASAPALRSSEGSARRTSDRKRTARGTIFDRLGAVPTFFLDLVLILASRLPFFLAYFPAVCTYDAATQVEQIGTGVYVEHHPLAHTLWIRASLSVGRAIHNVNLSVFLFTFVQALVLAAAFALGIALVKSAGGRMWVRICLLVFACAYPFHGYMSMSMTKDTLFSAFFLLQLLAFVQLLREGGNTLKPSGFDLLLTLSGVGMILFRNNGLYALLVPTVLLFFCVLFAKNARKLFARLLGGILLSLIVGVICLKALSAATDATQGDRREMLSVPIQQVARTVYYHGGLDLAPTDDHSILDSDMALVNDFILNEAYRNYNPYLSDPVKGNTNTYVVRYRTGDFARTYLNLLKHHPGDYVNAALLLTSGYFYVNDTSHAHIFQDLYPDMKGKGYVQTQWWESVMEPYGITKDSKWPAMYTRMENWADRNAYLDLPLLRYIFVPGVWLWLCLVLAGCLLVNRRWRLCLPLALVFGYFLTLLLGPTVQLRYLYPVMIAWPYLSALATQTAHEAEENNL